MIRDGKGGVVVVWRDDRDVFPDIYAQRIGADGTPQWKANGVNRDSKNSG
jgi:hypothetical protein